MTAKLSPVDERGRNEFNFNSGVIVNGPGNDKFLPSIAITPLWSFLCPLDSRIKRGSGN